MEKCNAGYFGDSYNLTTATCSGVCAAGEFAVAGSRNCTICPFASYSTAAASSTCTSCLSGYNGIAMPLGVGATSMAQGCAICTLGT